MTTIGKATASIRFPAFSLQLVDLTPQLIGNDTDFLGMRVVVHQIETGEPVDPIDNRLTCERCAMGRVVAIMDAMVDAAHETKLVMVSMEPVGDAMCPACGQWLSLIQVKRQTVLAEESGR